MEFLKDGELVYEDKEKEKIFMDAQDEVFYSMLGDFPDTPDLQNLIDVYQEVLSKDVQDRKRGKSMEESTKPIEVSKTKVKVAVTTIPTPSEIKEYLDQFVVGQEQPKKVLAVAAYNHYKRLMFSKTRVGTIKKSNVLMLGPTGTGKTFMCELISKILDVPFVVVDANSLTQAGYVGSDVEEMLERLYLKSENKLEKAQKGIILIDEIDKIACADTGGKRDVGGRGVQEQLLKIIEGGEFKVDIGSGPSKNSINFDTSEVLFVVAGAFGGIDRLVQAKSANMSRDFLGGKSEEVPLTTKEAYAKVSTADLSQFGIIPELLGRLPIRTILHPLDESDLVKIITSTKNSLVEQYTDSLAFDNVQLKITKGALTEIARRAILNQTGARGLQTVFEQVLLEKMFECPDNEEMEKFTIDKKMIEALTT
jgi:ATP-dependent Clp protease ATP-binding subunit ClpX